MSNLAATPTLRARFSAMFGLLAAANLAAWTWALLAFHDQPLLLGTALLAWSLGVRHAVDADHIAAIDNVTRKLMQEDQRPVSVGFFFALGHSAVVALAAALLAATATLLTGPLAEFKAVGGLIGTLVSALFLLAIAAVNTVTLTELWRAFRRVRGGDCDAPGDIAKPAAGGLLARLFRPLFGLVRRPWHMLPLGFLFGLGFDTATEVALLGLSATQASAGLSLGSVMVFPALFAAGMSLVDSADGALMLGAYDWALAQPMRKLFYNLVITLVLVVVAVLIAGIELLALLSGELHLSGRFWDAVSALSDNSSSLGFVIIGLFLAIWIGAAALWRYKGLDRVGAVGG